MTSDFSSPKIEEAKKLSTLYAELDGQESPENFKDYFDYFPELKNQFLENLLALQSEKKLSLKTV